MINGSGEAGIIFSAAELYRYMYDNNRELMRRVPGKYIARYMGIYAEKEGKRDLIWKDMTTFRIIAYDIWNLAYICFCIPEHAIYGVAVLLSCTIPALFIKRGTLIQARAYTMALRHFFKILEMKKIPFGKEVYA